MFVSYKFQSLLECSKMEFFEILLTKVNGYVGLLDGFRANGQTTPENILLSGLCKLHVEIFGTSLPIMDMFPYFSTSNAVETLQNQEIISELSRVMELDEPCLTFNQEIPELCPDYIPRCVSNKLKLDPAIFQTNVPDVFVFKDMDKRELNPSIPQNSSRFIFDNYKTDRNWKRLCDSAEGPIHLVAKEGEDYVLLESNGVTNAILKNSTRSRRETNAYVSENTLASRLMSSSLKGALVCDIAGSGKTCLMKSLGRQLADGAQRNVVFFIQLPVFFKQLLDQDELPDETESLSFALNYSCKSRLASHFLERYAALNNIAITFFLDGFEKFDRGLEHCIAFLTSLNSFQNVQVVVSSRINMRDFLERTFKIVSHDIMPFGVQPQTPEVVAQPCDKFFGTGRLTEGHGEDSKQSKRYGTLPLVVIIIVRYVYSNLQNYSFPDLDDLMRGHVMQNLGKLMERTKCTTVFMVLLVQEEVISQEEKEHLVKPYT